MDLFRKWGPARRVGSPEDQFRYSDFGFGQHARERRDKNVTKQTQIPKVVRKNPKNNKATVFNKETKDTKKAILHYKVAKSLDNYHLLEIDLETGRHHQIRSQLAHINCPIKGDLKYGFNRSNKDAGIHLHARKINFIHPVKKVSIEIIAPTPKDPIWNACN